MELFFEIMVKRCECDVLFYEWSRLLSEHNAAQLLLHPTMEIGALYKKSPSWRRGGL